MKYSIALLAVGAGAAMAQSLSDLPPCGQTCINNMINIASSQFGCALGDVTCYCTNAKFGYGVRDCSNQACSAQEAANVISYGTNFCANAVQSASGGVSSAPALSVLSSALVSATASRASVTGGAGGAQSTAVSTVPLVATAVSNGQTILQTTGFSTLYSSLTGAAGSAASSVAGSASSVAASISGSLASEASSLGASASSVASSLNSKASSIAASASGRVSSVAGAASSLASGATGASSTGAAPKMTGLPIVGAAGMAALFFL
ncbi:hypothetical protein BCR34DRAFT_262530 [Clohesyomyces aquaticus]|uniref:CFEM domain-containing protein n=1 Tax=Clohesyomyces aquaticus TaxID=1231657 RepID=A0A1Y1ZTT2_9PLEO|nr:hypothetical protein BCR34DRAFT_262530 [Clohesyomyces aquaticus]